MLRLLDLFCGAGGASKGYSLAGFEVVGVDKRLQPHYPFAFFQGDALSFPLEGFDAIHASPPCQAYSVLRNLGKQEHVEQPDLIGPVRERLLAASVPFVIENVLMAPLRSPIRLCGSSFGLAVQRHRFFECSFFALAPPCQHGATSIGVYGKHAQISKGMNRAKTLAEGAAAMGIDWMLWSELTQAIPPAYTQWLGEILRSQLAA